MNTSPEAKQAARLEMENTCSSDTQPLGYFVQQAIDTATAKLREELAIVERSRDSWKQIACAAQEQLAHQQPSAICPDCKQPLSGDDMVDREVHGRCQSQGEPSAPTPEPESLMTPEQVEAWSETCKKVFDEMARQNEKFSAPTPEVERLARELWAELFGEQPINEGDPDFEAIQAALAQARAQR